MRTIDPKKLFILLVPILFSANIVTTTKALASPTLPFGFKATKLASGFPGSLACITSALSVSGDGPFGDDLYATEITAGGIWRVSREGAGATQFTSVGEYPEGLTFSPFDSFGNYLYVAIPVWKEPWWGIVRVDPLGKLQGFFNPPTESLAFPPGGSDYGEYLYGVVGGFGSYKIYRIDSTGTGTEFTDTIPGGGGSIRFSHGEDFGTYLFMTCGSTGEIYKVYPDGSCELFADTGMGKWSIGGLDFDVGGAWQGQWGQSMYVGVGAGPNAGSILRITPRGQVSVWASGFEAVTDICFQPGGEGGFTMYIATGEGVWAIEPSAKCETFLMTEKGLGMTDIFPQTIDVYIIGLSFAPWTQYDLYVVRDVDPWTDGMMIPPRIPGTKTSFSTGADGSTPGIIVWNAPLTTGKFDILVDVNRNGKYDPGIDVLDDNDIVTAGFFVIPEYAFGTILALASCFTAFGAFRLSKRKNL